MQQCGFCSALAEIFRRLLCIGGSRRGSGESYYHELEDEESRRGGISVDRSENGLFIRMIDSNASPRAKPKSLSNSDWLLLEALDTRCRRQHHTGRFLTMHKRRRKRLITRSLTQDHALLDDIHHGQVQCVLDRVSQWPFNAFTLDNVTGGRSLPVLCVHLFHWYGLLDYFKLDVVRCWKFFSLIEEGYHSTNPYHNSIHATDVTQAMHCFLQEEKIRKYLTPLEIMASLIAAVTHDLDHPGVNQPFLIATSNHLAALYENSSVLENHHWRSAIGCLLESHVAEDLEDCRLELQRQISSLILATDITRQQEFLIRFKGYLDQDVLDMELQEHRHFILQIALKCADISNPCRPWEVSKKWSQKVCEEFFRQGDYERQLNLPVTALCDRQTSSVPKIQAGFFTFVVYPLFEEWHRFLGDGLSDDMMKNLHGNKLKWDALIKEENAEKIRSDTSDETEEKSSEGISLRDEISVAEPCKIHFLPVPDLKSQQKVSRRHSLPLCTLGSSIGGRSKSRRESLAIGEKNTFTNFSSGLLKEEEEEEEEEEKEVAAGAEESSIDRTPLSWETSSDESDDHEPERRPISSENLLPELSITSITTVLEASRLSSVLHKEQNQQKAKSKAQLTRQQTFPPLLPYVRQRYFSTTADMSRCAEFKADQKKEASSPENAEESVQGTPCGTAHGCKTFSVSKAPVLKETNRSSLSHGDHDRHNCNKRETDGSSHEKGAKVAKLAAEPAPESYEKENVDPRGFDADAAPFSKSGPMRRNSTQGHISRRRGSAPVGSEFFSPVALAFRGCCDRFSRRGSAPINAVTFSWENETFPEAPQDVNLTSSQHCPYQRRGSVPSEGGRPETAKTKNRNKKVLRRRSSGGPEMFSYNQAGKESIRWKLEMISRGPAGESDPDSLITSRRRGSLPIDFLLCTPPQSGDHREIHDS